MTVLWYQVSMEPFIGRHGLVVNRNIKMLTADGQLLAVPGRLSARASCLLEPVKCKLESCYY